MAEQKKETQKPTPRMYHIDSEKLMDIMRYLMTRPYGEVVKLMNSLSNIMRLLNLKVTIQNIF